jgi:hypothetical protein
MNMQMVTNNIAIETEKQTTVEQKSQPRKANKSWEACGKMRNAFKIIDSKFLL